MLAFYESQRFSATKAITPPFLRTQQQVSILQCNVMWNKQSDYHSPILCKPHAACACSSEFGKCGMGKPCTAAEIPSHRFNVGQIANTQATYNGQARSPEYRFLSKAHITILSRGPSDDVSLFAFFTPMPNHNTKTSMLGKPTSQLKPYLTRCRTKLTLWHKLPCLRDSQHSSPFIHQISSPVKLHSWSSIPLAPARPKLQPLCLTHQSGSPGEASWLITLISEDMERNAGPSKASIPPPLCDRSLLSAPAAESLALQQMCELNGVDYLSTDSPGPCQWSCVTQMLRSMSWSRTSYRLLLACPALGEIGAMKGLDDLKLNTNMKTSHSYFKFSIALNVCQFEWGSRCLRRCVLQATVRLNGQTHSK